jgi:hypothetical protein
LPAALTITHILVPAAWTTCYPHLDPAGRKEGFRTELLDNSDRESRAKMFQVSRAKGAIVDQE